MVKKRDMSTWNHRVMKRKDGDEDWFTIHEVYYKDNMDIEGYTKETISVGGNSIEDLRWTLEQMIKSLDKPILDYEEK